MTPPNDIPGLLAFMEDLGAAFMKLEGRDDDGKLLYVFSIATGETAEALVPVLEEFDSENDDE